MEKVILEEINRFSEKQAGLSIIEVPTGRGKTYNVLVWISNYMKQCREKEISPRKIFFLTTQLKNLPYGELKSVYYDKHQFLKDVIKIEKNLAIYLKDDGSFEKIQKEIPKEIKDWSEFSELNVLLTKYKRIQKSQKDYGQDYSSELNDTEEKLRDVEKKFRHHLESYILKQAEELKLDIPETEDKEKNLKRTFINQKFNWVKELYPAIESENRCVFLLSINKFLYGNTTIIEKTYRFINHSMTENAIIFIDEFDATKSIIEEIMIENAAKTTNDKILLFKNIKTGLENELPKTLDSTKGREDVLIRMRENAKTLYAKFFLSKRFKHANEYRDDARNFMFHDEVLHTLRDNNRASILAVNNPSTNKMDIQFLTKESETKLSPDSYISISSLLENIEEYFRSFRSFIKRWAQRYAKIANVTEEEAVYTILDTFDIHDEEVNMLMENTLYYSNYKPGEKQNKSLADIIPDTTYYNHGFDLHHYEDAKTHNENTKINTAQKHDTAEKLLKYLCERANVIGISATALVPTYDNYNLTYLKDKLGENYSILNDDAQSKVRKIEQEFSQKYEGSNVSINFHVLKNKDAFEKTSEINFTRNTLSKWMDSELAERLAAKIEAECNGNSYRIYRYLDVIEAMHDFWNKESTHAWLFLNWKTLKAGDTEFNEDIIKNALDKIIKSSKIKSNESPADIIVVLKSKDSFVSDKEKLAKDLSQGKRRLVFSAYQTLMAGQNLNFPFDPSIFKDYVVLGKKGDNRTKKTDFDGIVLGEITHQNFIKSFEPSDYYKQSIERIKLCSRIEDFYERDCIEYWEKERLLKYVLDTRNSPLDIDGAVGKVNNSSLIRNKVLQIVMQSIGRISRTHVKNKVINIYIANKNLTMIDKKELEKHVLTPELKELSNHCAEIISAQEEQDAFVTRAQKNSFRARRLIDSMMKKTDSNWDLENIQIWKNSRLDALKSPTSDTGFTYSCMSFETPEPCNMYYFVQKEDFGSVLIDYRYSKDDFKIHRNLKNFFGEKPVIIQEVSEEDCRLQTILSCPGMKEFFENNGYATSFMPKKFIMTPVIYQNIYKGALGEVAGKFIFENFFKIHLNEISDPSQFELFDYEMKPGVFVDFKHWRPYYYTDLKKMYSWISKKLDMCNGTHAYIVNVLADGILTPDMTTDPRITVIQNLLNEKDGSVNWKAFEAINTEHYEIEGDAKNENN